MDNDQFTFYKHILTLIKCLEINTFLSSIARLSNAGPDNAVLKIIYTASIILSINNAEV